MSGTSKGVAPASYPEPIVCTVRRHMPYVLLVLVLSMSLYAAFARLCNWYDPPPRSVQ